MDAQELKRRTKDFAHRCVKLCLALPEDYLCHHIRKQLIRSSTSVACNYRAACIAQSKSDFVSKLSIVIEEADESCFWMEFIVEEELLEEEKVLSLLNEGRELAAIFVASRKTTRDRNEEFALKV